MNSEEENIYLKKKLSVASSWMQKQVRESQKEVILQKSDKNVNDFYHQNLEDIISEKIYSFFPSSVMMYFPDNTIKNIVSSELIYYHILQGGNIDGIGVIIGYQKVLDAMVELYISKGFRKYIEKNELLRTPENIPLEKSLHSIVSKRYIFSLGRLYEALNKIQHEKELTPYLSYFKSYLINKPTIHKALLESDFLIQLELLMNLHVFSEKRHMGTLSPEDTKLSRTTCIGNFTDTNSLIYILAASQALDI